MMAVNPNNLPPQSHAKEQIGANFSAASHSYNQAARLQRVTGQQLFTINQDVLKGKILDLGCGTGINTQRLCTTSNHVTACDISSSMLNQTRIHTDGQCTYVQADAKCLPFAHECFDGIYSNLMIQWLDDLPHTLNQLRNLLTPQGYLCIATLTERTLYELSDAWGKVDDDAHVSQFMPLGQLLACFEQGGFEVQLHQQTVVLEYPQVTDLARELKQLGANYVKNRRQKGLTGRGKWQQLALQYELYRNDNQMLPASYQVAYIRAHKKDN